MPKYLQRKSRLKVTYEVLYECRRYRLANIYFLHPHIKLQNRIILKFTKSTESTYKIAIIFPF